MKIKILEFQTSFKEVVATSGALTPKFLRSQVIKITDIG